MLSERKQSTTLYPCLDYSLKEIRPRKSRLEEGLESWHGCVHEVMGAPPTETRVNAIISVKREAGISVPCDLGRAAGCVSLASTICEMGRHLCSCPWGYGNRRGLPCEAWIVGDTLLSCVELESPWSPRRPVVRVEGCRPGPPGR